MLLSNYSMIQSHQMNLEKLKKRFLCYSCNEYHLAHSESDSIPCPVCGSPSDHKGYDLKVSLSHAKLNVQQQRREHRKALVQPYRGGEFSAEFKEAHPEISKGMVEEGAITKKQYDNAKKVWGDDDIR